MLPCSCARRPGARGGPDRAAACSAAAQALQLSEEPLGGRQLAHRRQAGMGPSSKR